MCVGSISSLLTSTFFESSIETHIGMASRSQLAPYLCAAIVLVLNLAFYSMMTPLTRAIELAVCYEHYLVHDPNVIELGGYVDEKLCKVVSIQERLAWILALNGILHFCCG